MILAIADKNGAVGVHKQPVQTGEFAGKWISIWAIALFTGAGNQFQISSFDVDHSQRMTLGVGEIDVTIRRDSNSFGS